MTPDQLRAFAAQLLSQVDTMGKKIQRIETVNEQLTHEIALFKRHKFAKRSEQLSPDQGSLLDDLLHTDIAAIEAELKAVNPPAAPPGPGQQPKRAPLPPQFPRTVIRHEPENTQCVCGCQLQRVGEDVSEKLDYTPGVFTVEQHVRGKWACRECETLIQAPVPTQVIDKGIPTAGLLAHLRPRSSPTGARRDHALRRPRACLPVNVPMRRLPPLRFARAHTGPRMPRARF